MGNRTVSDAPGAPQKETAVGQAFLGPFMRFVDPSRCTGPLGFREVCARLASWLWRNDAEEFLVHDISDRGIGLSSDHPPKSRLVVLSFDVWKGTPVEFAVWIRWRKRIGYRSWRCGGSLLVCCPANEHVAKFMRSLAKGTSGEPDG